MLLSSKCETTRRSRRVSISAMRHVSEMFPHTQRKSLLGWLLSSGLNSPYEHGHPHILTALVDVSPCVLNHLPLSVRQRLGSLWTVLTLHVPPLSPQQLRRRWGCWGRLPVRHPSTAQQRRGSQEGSRKVGGEGRGERDGQMRPHGGSWRRDEVRNGAVRRVRGEEEDERRRAGRQTALPLAQGRGKTKLQNPQRRSKLSIRLLSPTQTYSAHVCALFLPSFHSFISCLPQ